MDWYLDTAVQGAVTRLRHEVMDYLERHADTGVGLDEAELIFAEVAGNTVRHAAGPVWVSLTWPEERPRLTVWDLGPGFDLAPLDALDALAEDRDPVTDLEAESGRGYFLISHLAPELAVRARASSSTGAVVTVTLPVKRAPGVDHDPPHRSYGALPELAEARPEGGFGRESFLRALVVQLARAVEFQHGPDAAEKAVAQVGADVGGQMEEEYRLAKQVTGRMTPQQVADCYVRLKHAIDGGFYVVEANEHRIVLGNTRCPFGDVVTKAPSLCRMTSSVFGGIAARNNDGPVDVLLEERIAVGDPGCRVVVALDGDAGIEVAAAHRYRPPQG